MFLQDHEELFQFFDENSNGVLELNEVGKLNAAMFNLFPRFGYKGKEPPGMLDFNAEVTNGFAHRYHLGESTLIFRHYRCDFKFCLIFFFS